MTVPAARGVVLGPGESRGESDSRVQLDRVFDRAVEGVSAEAIDNVNTPHVVVSWISEPMGHVMVFGRFDDFFAASRFAERLKLDRVRDGGRDDFEVLVARLTSPG